MNANLSALLRLVTATVCTLTLSIPLFAAGKLSKDTADYYKAQYDLFEGKSIRVEVTHIKPFHCKSNIEDLRFYHAFTYDKDQRVPGGWIVVAVPKAAEAAFVKKYGTVPSGAGEGGLFHSQTSKLSGVLKADGKRFWFIDFENKCAALIDARRQEFIVDPAKDGDPDTKEGNRPEGGRRGWKHDNR